MTPEQAHQRAAVVAEARRWIRTPYHHGAQVMGHGVDCVLILRAVYNAVGLTDIPDPRPYPMDWHLHRSEERYLAGLERYSVEVDEPGPGDVVIFKWGRCFAHAGIVTAVTPRLRFVHAAAVARLVMEEEMRDQSRYSGREARYFSLWGATGGP